MVHCDSIQSGTRGTVLDASALRIAFTSRGSPPLGRGCYGFARMEGVESISAIYLNVSALAALKTVNPENRKDREIFKTAALASDQA